MSLPLSLFPEEQNTFLDPDNRLLVMATLFAARIFQKCRHRGRRESVCSTELCYWEVEGLVYKAISSSVMSRTVRGSFKLSTSSCSFGEKCCWKSERGRNHNK